MYISIILFPKIYEFFFFDTKKIYEFNLKQTHPIVLPSLCDMDIKKRLKCKPLLFLITQLVYNNKKKKERYPILKRKGLI